MTAFVAGTLAATTKVTVTEVEPAGLVAVSGTAKTPAVVGVPEKPPVEVSMVSPGGSVPALYCGT